MMKEWMVRACPWLIVAALLALPGNAICNPDDFMVAVMPLDAAFARSDLDDSPGFILPSESVLIVVSQDEAGELAAGSRIRPVGRHPDVPLWITYAELPEHIIRDLGLRILVMTETYTVFEASKDAAYYTLARGYPVVEIELRPVAALKRPPRLEGFLDELAGERPLTPSRTRLIRSVSDGVDSLRLERTIYRLSYDADMGEYRSRFAGRPELSRDITPYLVDTLGSYIAPYGGSVWEQEFIEGLGGPYAGAETVFTNVVGELPGTKTSARYVICAHYDAIALREPAGWDWVGDPAPGADDNATGTAVLLECARLLANVDLDFGLTFIAFSAEEVGLLGSKHFVSELSPEDSILGVINVDMVGDWETAPTIQVVYDRQSEWLSDRFVEMADLLEIDAVIEPLDLSGIQGSDHAPFWVMGIPGNMLSEEREKDDFHIGGPVNPYYHSLGDTLGHIDIGLVAENARLVVGLLARFAASPEDTLPDLVMTEGSIEWDWQGRGHRDAPAAGETVTATVRALNTGASMAEPATYDLNVWRGVPEVGAPVYSSTSVLKVLAGHYTDLEATWEIDPSVYGKVQYAFDLEPHAGAIESNYTNNHVSVVLTVMAQTVLIDDLHAFPNPVTDPQAANLSFEIFHPESDFDGIMEVWLFDILGKQVAYGTLEKTPIAGDIDVGENVVGLSEIFPDGLDLAPGLYICTTELRFIGEAGSAKAETRFAVAR